MGYPFIRADEQTRAPGPNPGVCVRFPGGRYWFPGATPELAMIMARQALPDSVLDDPHTKIEFGEAVGKEFLSERVLKATRGEVGGGQNDR